MTTKTYVVKSRLHHGVAEGKGDKRQMVAEKVYEPEETIEMEEAEAKPLLDAGRIALPEAKKK